VARLDTIMRREQGEPTRMTREWWAAAAFAAVVVAAVPIYLWSGRHQWFFFDEWDFLAARRATDLHDLLRPHNEHWQTLPILVYRALWRLVGLRRYWPYQILTIGLHLTAASLLRTLMRRARVDPWIATAAASVFVLFGAGHENIMWGFQIGFIGSLVCGLGALLLADHDGTVDRRDALSLAAGLAALMCSGVGVTMCFVVCLAVLLRRGWRAAALYAASLAGVFIAWWLAFGRGAYESPSPSLRDTVEFVAVGTSNLFAQLGQLPGVGIALAILLVGGLVLAWGRLPLDQLRKQAAAPGALLAGGVVFLVITAIGRLGPASIAIRLGVIKYATDGARASRYVHLLAAMALPALAVAADAVIRRWRVTTPFVFVLLLAGVPGNVAAIRQGGIDLAALGQRDLVLTLPQSPFARRVPRTTKPLGIGGPEVTMAWLLDGVASGRIPRPPRTNAELATASLRLVLRQSRAPTPPVGCVPLDVPLDRRVPPGESVAFARGPLVVQLRVGGALSASAGFQLAGGQRLEAITGPLDLRLSSATIGPHAALCP
jgi:hypothetical protein